MARRCYLDTRFELDIDTDFDGDGNKLELVDGGMTSDQPAPIGQLGQRAAWSSRINRLSDRDAHYFDFLIDVPALAGNQNANYLLGVLAYEQAEVRIYPARYELVIGGTPVGTHNVASTAGRHNLGICAKGALSGEVSGVWLDGAQIFNGVGLWTQSTPRALFTTRNADPTGLSQINGVVLLDLSCERQCLSHETVTQPM